MKNALVLFLFLSLISCTQKEEKKPTPDLLPVTDLTISEGPNQVASVVFELNEVPSDAVTFLVSSIDGTATSNKDFDKLIDRKITFLKDETKAVLNINIKDDLSRFPDRYFYLDLTEPSGLTISKDKIKISITDNDIYPEINFDVSGQVVDKASNVAISKLRLSVPASENLSIEYTVSGTLSTEQHSFRSGNVIFLIGQTEAYITGNLFANTSGPNKTIQLQLLRATGVQIGAIAQQTIILTDEGLGLIALLSGYPEGDSNLTKISVSVSGNGVTKYKYKILSNKDECNLDSDGSRYSLSRDTGTLITDDISGLSDGTIYLCVLGGNDLGIFQDKSIATKISWQKITVAPKAPSLVSISAPFKDIGPNKYLSNQTTPTLNLTGITDKTTVEVYEDSQCSGTLIGQAFVDSGGEGSVKIKTEGEGTKIFYVKAKNRFGQVSSCTLLVSAYQLDLSAPKITKVEAISNCSYCGKSSQILIDITFSEEILLGKKEDQIPYLILNTLPLAGTATYVSNSGNTVRFTYTPNKGQSTQKLELFSTTAFIAAGALIKDLADNQAILTLPIPGDIGSLSNTYGQLRIIMIDTEDPEAVKNFYDGVYGKTNESPTFSWLKTFDYGGSGIQKYQVAIATTPVDENNVEYEHIYKLPWTDVGTINQADETTFKAIKYFPTFDLNNRPIKYYGAIRAVDNANNVSLINCGSGFYIDDNPPSKTIVTINQNSTFSKSISPQISWAESLDGESAIDYYEIAIGTSPGANNLSNGWVRISASTLTYAFNNYSGEYGQTYHATVRAVDLAGNYSISDDTLKSRWTTVKPNLTPKVSLSFKDAISQKDKIIISESPSPNYNNVISGLDLPVLVSVKPNSGFDVGIGTNGIDFYSYAIHVKNGDQIYLKVKTPSQDFNEFNLEVQIFDYDTTKENPLNTKYFWKISPFTCRENFLYVKSNKAEIDDFCVAKYLAKVNTTKDSNNKIIISSISVDPSIIENVKKLEATQSSPGVAGEACASLGDKFDVINNAEYNIIANSIENESFNWDFFQSQMVSMDFTTINVIGNISVGSARYYESNPDEVYFDQTKTSQYTASSDETPCYGLYDKQGMPINCNLLNWHEKRRVLKFQDQYIWDFISDLGQSVSFFDPRPTSQTVDYYLPYFNNPLLSHMVKVISFKSAMPYSWNRIYDYYTGLSYFNSWYFTPYEFTDSTTGKTSQLDEYLEMNRVPSPSLSLIRDSFSTQSFFDFYMPDNKFASGFGFMLIGAMLPTSDSTINYHTSYGSPITAKRGHGGLYETQLGFPDKTTTSTNVYWTVDSLKSGVRCVQRQHSRQIGFNCNRITINTEALDFCLPKTL